MSETSFVVRGWDRDEALCALLEIFDCADKHGRTSQQALAEAKRTLEHALTEATRELTEAKQELTEVSRNLDNERAKSSRLEAEVSRLSADLVRMQNSLSWRVTKPLRSVRFAAGALLHPPSGI